MKNMDWTQNEEDPDVELRGVIDGDLDIFFQNQLDPKANHMAAFTSIDPSDRSSFDQHWSRIRKIESVVVRTILVNNQVVGSVLKYEDDGKTEVSYWIGRKYWGKGVSTIAVMLFLQEQTQRPMYGRVAADNYGSIRVLEKCGFKRIGKDRGFANARGEEIDEFVYCLDYSLN